MGKSLSTLFSGCIFALVFALTAAVAPAQAQSHYTQEDLDAMLAPIALYPDELLTQVLIAATYPDDVADARAYLDRYPSLSGALLGYQVNAMPWDDSVKSLAQFPSVLSMLDDQPDWTDAIGYAFLNQQSDVMRTIQRLRQRAERAGYLRTNDDQVVDVDGGYIVIEPRRDGFYRVPYYDPYTVYGKWWWPHHPPYYWEPPQRYRPAAYSVANGIFFGVSVGILNSIFHPVRPDWHHHHVIIIGGTKPGGQWHWKPRPQKPGQPSRPGRPNRPPTSKPPLKPRPPRPTPPKPGKPEIQPPRPGRPEVQPPKPQPEKPQRPGRPEVRPHPEKPVTLPAKPTAPVTGPAPQRPERPMTRPVPVRPVVTPPATEPPTPITRPTRPEVTRPARPTAPAGRPAVQTPPKPKPEVHPAHKPAPEKKADDDDKKDRRQR